MEEKIAALIENIRMREKRIRRTIDEAKEVGANVYVPILSAREKDFQEIRNELENILKAEESDSPIQPE